MQKKAKNKFSAFLPKWWLLLSTVWCKWRFQFSKFLPISIFDIFIGHLLTGPPYIPSGGLFVLFPPINYFRERDLGKVMSNLSRAWFKGMTKGQVIEFLWHNFSNLTPPLPPSPCVHLCCTYKSISGNRKYTNVYWAKFSWVPTRDWRNIFPRIELSILKTLLHLSKQFWSSKGEKHTRAWL